MNLDSRPVVPSSVWFGPGLRTNEVHELMAFLGAHQGVAVLQWPRDAGHLEALTTVGLPRLLLVHPSSEDPPADGPLQQALPASADGDAVHGHLIALSRRAAQWRAQAGTPVLDESGAMRVGARRIELPPIAGRLAVALVARFGCPVDAELLSARSVPGTSLTMSRLRGHLARLNRLINPLGLEVAHEGGGGHLMRWCPA